MVEIMAFNATPEATEHIPPPASLQGRLALKNYDGAECLAAIKGEKIPINLGLKITRLCLIRGLRYHTNFGLSLYSLQDSEFTRALNARRIMSNDIPEMNTPEEFPYCIWYPDIGSEETYRKLAKTYPRMRYQVGRACAVAGYLDLFRELELLPEVAIAEEARENKESGQGIFEEIMRQPIRYAVMDDYTCSVNLENPRGGAYLNGDTAVRCLLDIKQEFRGPDYFMDDTDFPSDGHSESNYFNITEDWNIDDHDSEPLDYTSVVPLLYSPLPLNLQTVHKDLLIVMAAYYGNIDRFTRLRRPVEESLELSCAITRGIYHNTMFAKWWSLQPFDPENDTGYQKSINARWIMNNDLSRITPETSENELPSQIWYPNWAHWSTYEELARRKPIMRTAAARACIVANYQESYVRIGAKPDYQLAEQAKLSSNPFYLEDLRQRGKEMSIDIDTPDELWGSVPAGVPPENGGKSLMSKGLSMADLDVSQSYWYDGWGIDVSAVELLVCVPDEMKPTEEFPVVRLDKMYLQACRPDGDHGRERYPGGRERRHSTRGRVIGRGRGKS